MNVSSIMLEMLGSMNSEMGAMVMLAWSERSLLRLRRSVTVWVMIHFQDRKNSVTRRVEVLVETKSGQGH